MEKKKVTFEDPLPLSVIHKMLQDQGHSLTRDVAAAIIAKYAPVIISKDEDKAINSRGYKVHPIPEERYAHIQLDFPLAIPQE